MPQFIYTMKGLGKVHPPDAKVLEDIWLSFLPGAKIGVLGLNGAGKSSLLKIMAGEDTSFLGEAFPADGITVGFLHQEPRLNAAKTVLGNVEEGVADIKALLTRYDEVNERLGTDLSPEEMEKVLAELDVDLVVPGEQGLDRGDAFLDIAEDRFRGVQSRLLRQEADRDSLGGKGLPQKARVLPGHDLQERALPCPVQAEDADLRAEIKRQPDIFEHTGVGGMDLPEAFHGVDELRHQ